MDAKSNGILRNMAKNGFSLDIIYLFVYKKTTRGVAQSGSAHDWGSCGRWFKSSRPDRKLLDDK